ncbi:uncharacterized protein BDW43DRAFT_322393 [Aspergillus alliaceus]|uniref:uncharacterized protein n=1 Tax=Petromyces alliaceus TaxID=209559 RepID=UPI0012A52B7E|nr:uncharacterized protein BDW43DRAFT_322393 [Aspergillus alliaceus]KAB8229094.1 hypothetical protein BDW43DRAFT_322393 [Aspergillus alliaceus]
MQGRVVFQIGGSGKKAGHYNLGVILAYRDFNVSLLDQLRENKSLRMIGYCDKLNAGYAANWYARQAEAIVISGCLPQDTFGQDRYQALRVFAEVTTLSTRITAQSNPVKSFDYSIARSLHDSLPFYIEILSTAKPIKLVGARACHGISPDILMALIDKLGCAVFVQPDGKSTVPDEPKCKEAVMGSGLWVTVGCHWTDHHTLGSCLDICCLDICPPDGNVIEGICLGQISDALIKSDIPQKPTTLTSLQAIPSVAKMDESVINNPALSVYTVLQGIQVILSPNDTLIAKTGDSYGTKFHMQMIYRYQLGRLDGRVITMIGDGSQTTAQVLSIMIRTRVKLASFVTSLCNMFHASYLDNPHAHEIPENNMDPLLFSMQVKAKAELLMALDRIEREPSKMTVLDCCIHPTISAFRSAALAPP